MDLLVAAQWRILPDFCDQRRDHGGFLGFTTPQTMALVAQDQTMFMFPHSGIFLYIISLDLFIQHSVIQKTLLSFASVLGCSWDN